MFDTHEDFQQCSDINVLDPHKQVVDASIALSLVAGRWHERAPAKIASACE